MTSRKKHSLEQVCFLGSACARALLGEGHQVSVLTRRASIKDKAALAEKWGLRHDLKEQLHLLDPAVLSRPPAAKVDVVINMAGAPLMDPPGRWGDQQVKEIFASRIDLTKQLVQYLSSMDTKSQPSVMVSGSAIGWYGVPSEAQQESGTVVTEDSKPVETQSLSHRLCQEWEAAALGDGKLKTRIVLLRTGIVLDGDQGALARMLPPFSLGLGGIMGSGQQWLPWIHLYDWLQIVGLALRTAELAGPLNAVSPMPVRNSEFTTVLASGVGMPAFIPMPEAAVRLLFGRGPADELLLRGQRILPAKAEANGLKFKYPHLKDAITAIVKLEHGVTHPKGDNLVTARIGELLPAFGNTNSEQAQGQSLSQDYLVAIIPQGVKK
eukprot:g43636.t1